MDTSALLMWCVRVQHFDVGDLVSGQALRLSR